MHANPQTPYLLMDLDALERQYLRFLAAFPGIDVHYAMKCNPDSNVLRRLHRLGCSFEIALANELDALVDIGVDPSSVVFSNPVKVPADVERTAQLGVWRFSCDSLGELEKIAAVQPGASVYFRVATHPASSDLHSEGKFGIDVSEVEQLASRALELGLNVYGLAFHVGSQMLDASAWVEAIKHCGALMRSFMSRDIVIAMVDIGGGFPARYSDDVLELEAFGQTVADAITKHLPYYVRIIAEPGRALVAEAGVLVSTVIGVAERRGRRWVHLDVGAFNGVMEALETNNTLRFPVSDSRQSDSTVRCHLTGLSCDSQDTILFHVPMSEDLALGDTVYIGTAGAYTTSYASRFNGFDIPPVVCDVPVSK